MLQSCDILAVQEHWLFSFQLADIESYFPTHTAFSRAVDENNPLPPTQKPRGYGGVSVLCRRSMAFKTRRLPLGDCRLVVVEVASSPPLCICNVYMPCRNTKGEKSGDGYKSCLDQIREVLLTYCSTHVVLLVGDLNASLATRKGNQQDMLLKQFVKQFDLSSKQEGECTFFHPNKNDQAEIDYILYSDRGVDVVKSVNVMSKDAENTSDHVPVVASLNIETEQVHVSNQKIKCKPKWDKCDIAIYKQTVRENLHPFSTFQLKSNSEIDILQPLGHLNSVLKMATVESIPKHKSEVQIKKLKHRPWSEDIFQAVRNCRLKWWEWRKAGAVHDPDNQHYIAMTKARKFLRKMQRQEAVRSRIEKVEEIMNSQDDSRSFFKLIRQQRKSAATQTRCLVVDGKSCETDDEICNGWAAHFQKLATPLMHDDFDQQYKAQVDSDVEHIASLCETEQQPIEKIAEKEVHSALKRLKNNKAMDSLGLTSEHFKLGGRDLISFLTDFLNHIVSTKHISVVLKEGIVTPIFKKGDDTDPGNYRGITVTPVLLKILEHVLNTRHNKILIESQSRLQRGFTQGSSSINAALVLTECVLESKNNKQDILLTTIDTQKAFDVVDQNSLLRKLFLDGVQGDDWLLLKDLYSDCSSRIKWAGHLSDPFLIEQGVRQGGVLSTSHYKRYNNPLLLHLEDTYSEVKIGSINVPHITVADDLALLSREKPTMQTMIWDVGNNANRERYFIHPTKSCCLMFCAGRRVDSTDFVLSGQRVASDTSTIHLGIKRDVSGKANIDEKVALGRRTAYSLMGAGFHSVNGLKVSQNAHIWQTFVVPRMVYG
ncbi:MAG: reverse transcriptase family protein, partial [Candidatus Thiodiazotropha sp.]